MTGTPCDEDGGYISPDSPPPPRHGPDVSPNNWEPYDSRVEFELAELLYTRNQMSAGHIDSLLHLWAASLVKHCADAPFIDHTNLYNTIDSTSLGGVPWESFSLKYGGDLPATNIPDWMTSGHDVWFRDPRTLVRDLISNPDFKDVFDYAPLQEYDSNGNHRFQDLMLGNWAWKQAVSSTLAI